LCCWDESNESTETEEDTKALETLKETRNDQAPNAVTLASQVAAKTFTLLTIPGLESASWFS
jgi:hypothetical protein